MQKPSSNTSLNPSSLLGDFLGFFKDTGKWIISEVARTSLSIQDQVARTLGFKNSGNLAGTLLIWWLGLLVGAPAISAWVGATAGVIATTTWNTATVLWIGWIIENRITGGLAKLDKQK